MNCNQVRDRFIEMTGAQSTAAPAEVSAHLATCGECSQLWQALKQTMSAMDEWTAPEPSPYFNTRLQARLAEVKREEATAPTGVLAWLLKPAFGMPVWRPMLAGALTFVLAVGISLYRQPSVNPSTANNTNTPTAQASAAVNDLQKLDKNEDLYSDFELLDDLKVDNAQSGTSTRRDSSAEL